jgi:DNA repair protein RadC
MAARRRRRPAGLSAAERARALRLCRENLRLQHHLVGAGEVGRHRPTHDAPTLTNPEAAAAYLGPEMVDLAQEQLRAVLLDTRKRVLGVSLLHQGGLDTIEVCLRDCFREAVRANAAGLILVHNHPSGDPTPSPEDLRVTLAAAKAGELLGVELVDHLVVAAEGHVSLRRAGLFALPARPVALDCEAA